MVSPGDIRYASKGRFKLTVPGCNDAFPGVRFVDGVTVEPVSALIALRCYQAFGNRLVIERVDEPGDRAAEPSPVDPVAADADDEARFVSDSDDALDAMSKRELIHHAKALGLKPHWNTGTEKIRAMIRARQNQD